MRLKNKKPSEPDIHVLMEKGKIVLKNGFAILTKGTHLGFEILREDALGDLYHIPKNIDFNK